jgi:uncharacterized protein YdaU (DUF1376 family)
MAKDPAFLFYPGDYIGGTMGMTFEEKGAYIELLMMQFMRGHMTEHMIVQVIGQRWDNIKHKFVQDDKGLFFNVRLDEEKIKRANFTKSRNNNKKGKNQHNKIDEELGHISSHMSGHVTSHMENENENVNKDINTNNLNNEILKNSNLFRQPNKPTYEQVHEVFFRNGGTEEMAKSFFNKWEGTGWFLNGSPIVNFVKLAENYIITYNKNKTEKNGTKSRAQKQSDSMRYLLERGKEEYAKVMAINSQNKTD